MISTAALGEHQPGSPVAAWWHTVLLAVILLGIAARGALFGLLVLWRRSSGHG